MTTIVTSRPVAAVEALGLDDVDDLESCLLNRQLEVKGEVLGCHQADPALHMATDRQ